MIAMKRKAIQIERQNSSIGRETQIQIIPTGFSLMMVVTLNLWKIVSFHNQILISSLSNSNTVMPQYIGKI